MMVSSNCIFPGRFNLESSSDSDGSTETDSSTDDEYEEYSYDSDSGSDSNGGSVTKETAPIRTARRQLSLGCT